MKQSSLSQLVEVRLGRDLRQFVLDMRESGHGWRAIARGLSDVTDTKVSHEALRAWFADEPEVRGRPGPPALELAVAAVVAAAESVAS